MKFEVYKEGKLSERFSLDGAYIFGQDQIPFKGPAKISYNQGVITAQKKNNDATGLAVLWPVHGFGKVVLTTTRLPERALPYNLNVELARAKMMQITIKREDWSFLDEGSDKLTQIKELFIKAIENIQNPSVASVYADDCLKKAIVFSELLASKNAELYLKAKTRSGGFANHCMGGRIDPDRVGDSDYISRLTEMFGLISIPVSWAMVESEKDEFNFKRVDKCLKALAGKKVAISMGPLLSFDKKDLPDWILKDKISFSKLRERAYNFVNKVVSKYSPKVHAWRVISGMNSNNHFGFSFEQILEMTRAAIMAARAVDSRSLKIVDIAMPWGEYYAHCSDTIPPLVYLDMVNQSGINPDAIGVQIRFGANQMDMRLRDMMQVSAIFDKFAPLQKPLHITAVEVPSAMAKDQNGAELLNSGIWRNKWSPAIQAKWIENFYKIILAKPFVSTVTYDRFADSPTSNIAQSGLLTEKLKKKDSYQALQKLKKTLVLTK